MSELTKLRSRWSDWNELQSYYYWREEAKRSSKKFLAKDAPELATGESYYAFLAQKRGYHGHAT